MFRTAFLMLGALTVVTGLIYPLAVTGLAGVLFPFQARGSLTIENGRVAGSELIGRQFDDPKYFWPRPSATPDFPYNAGASSGSNYGPRHPGLRKAMDERRRALREADPDNAAPIPIDLLTASGSGLDPHISPEASLWQAPRIARLRRMEIGAVRALIAAHTRPRQLGFLGEPVVNVAALNRALDGKLSKPVHLGLKLVY
ncbi:MAG: potassium-transporting ATPase subunit KdpC [Bryobacteraceae bacterium]|nr:potassium-transporting ATPase subunit KdpC [Bryobacteraceae bacterium]